MVLTLRASEAHVPLGDGDQVPEMLRVALVSNYRALVGGANDSHCMPVVEGLFLPLSVLVSSSSSDLGSSISNQILI